MILPHSHNREGFTLLELIAVIGIIAIMSVFVVGGFNGILKAFGNSSGSDGVRRAIMLARQQACVDGHEISFQVTGYNTYVLVRRAGTVTGRFSGRKEPIGSGSPITAKWISDDYANLDESLSGLTKEIGNLSGSDKQSVWKDYVQRFADMRVYDMTDHVFSSILCPQFYDANDDTCSLAIEDNAYTRGFKVGSVYGYTISPEQSLPKGLVFDGVFNASTGALNEDAIRKAYVLFLPDGSLDSSSQTTFKIVDATTDRGFEIKINSQGQVSTTSIQ